MYYIVYRPNAIFLFSRKFFFLSFPSENALQLLFSLFPLLPFLFSPTPSSSSFSSCSISVAAVAAAATAVSGYHELASGGTAAAAVSSRLILFP